MKNSLINYMNKRLIKEMSFNIDMQKPGPVVTISREVGCNGLLLAKMLSERLNEINHLEPWRVISKEVFQESARELDLDLNRVTKIFKQKDRYAFEEILAAFNTKSYKSDRKIIKTVVDVVHSNAEDGNCIIVGRAGHIIAKDIDNAIHVRLFAPLEERIKSVMVRRDLTRIEAIRFIQSVEKDRHSFREAIYNSLKRTGNFDLIINTSSFSDGQIINLIENAIKEKGLLHRVKQKLEFF